MPAVREPGDEAPETLEIVEVRPGVTLQLNAADRKAWEEHNATETSAPLVTESAPDADEATVTAVPKPRKK